MRVSDWMLDVVAHLNPEFAPAIGWVRAHPDEVHKLAPVVEQTIAEGGSALAAAEKAAPDLARAIRDLVDASAAPATKAQFDLHAENATRQVFGQPRMTAAQELAWASRATPPSAGSSAVGSG